MLTQRFLLLLCMACFTTTFVAAQTSPLNGAWSSKNEAGTTTLITIVDNYLMQTVYEPNRFVSTRGGTYQVSGDKLSLHLEFDTADSTRIGQTDTYQLTQEKGKLSLQGLSGKQTFSRIDEKPTPLIGLWRITGRANESGQIVSIHQQGARKTIKLLTGSRFQWAAINPQTKQFSGTGGGTYTLSDGKYTETIDFFSRDNSRVGRSLSFSAEINGNEWHHSGQSSTGGKVDEIWSREK